MVCCGFFFRLSTQAKDGNLVRFVALVVVGQSANDNEELLLYRCRRVEGEGGWLYCVVVVNQFRRF